jgi:hypothetical protein
VTYNLGIEHERERFLEDFEILDGVIIPVGDYRHTQVVGGFQHAFVLEVGVQDSN